ncbi:MAG: sulfatase [Planctomycetota bacterium]
MSRFRGPVVLVALLPFFAGATQGEPSDAHASDERPNILFVFSDDHAAHAIGAYRPHLEWGGWLDGVDTTPHIDRLAADGALFSRSFCTNALCGPSRASILTGLHSKANGFMRNGDRFDPDQRTFPKLLQAAGYATAVIGKWHLASDPQGFDHWEVLPGQGRYYNPDLRSAAGKRRVEGHCTDVVTDLAVEWLEGVRDSEKPWLLMCQHKAPHRPWLPAGRHLDLWAGEDLPEPPTLFDDHADDAPGARASEMSIAGHMAPFYDLQLTDEDGTLPDEGGWLARAGRNNRERMTDAQRAAWDAAFEPRNRAFHADAPEGDALVRWRFQRYLKNYLRCVRGVDDSVGRLTAWLDENGLAENTVVIYCSDQGFYLGDHGWYDKRWMYEESLTMPFIVRWPARIAPGTVVDALVQNIDYAPLFLELAGLDAPGDMHGRSLLPMLGGEVPADWRDAIYYRYGEFPGPHQVPKHHGVRTATHKLLRFPELDAWELYDLTADPDERTNVFGDPEYVGVAASLAERLGALRQRFDGYRVR